MAAKVNLPVRGVIENMSWFTGDDGKRYEIFGSGGGQASSPTSSASRCSVSSRSCPRCARAATTGKPITAVDPDSEAGRAFHEIARRIAVDMRPKKIYSDALKVL